MTSLFTSYKEYKNYVKKYGWELAYIELKKMIKEKYGQDVEFKCEHCAFAALGENGYISDIELEKIHSSYITKMKNKKYKKMGL